MTVKDIDNQITLLRQQKNELLREEVKEFQKEAQKNVGRCFIINNRTYVKVIGVPKIEETKSGPRINMYQYPAIMIESGVVPFDYDTLFSGAWGAGNNLDGTKYQEISPEEFEIEFNRRLEEFRERILENKNL